RIVDAARSGINSDERVGEDGPGAIGLPARGTIGSTGTRRATHAWRTGWSCRVRCDQFVRGFSALNPGHDGAEEIDIEGTLATTAVITAWEEVKTRELFHM